MANQSASASAPGNVMGNETNSQKKGSTDAQTTKGVNRMGKCTKFIAIAAINETERAKADRERARERE